MPYFLLILGLAIGVFALYRFFRTADMRQVKALFITAGFIVFCLALFYLAVTGRLPAALALLAAISPTLLGLWKIKREKKGADRASSFQNAPPGKTSLGRKEALEILGLDENAGENDIRAAYKKLMGKIHPDREGSAWLAARLNEARDVLLKRKKP